MGEYETSLGIKGLKHQHSNQAVIRILVATRIHNRYTLRSSYTYIIVNSENRFVTIQQYIIPTAVSDDPSERSERIYGLLLHQLEGHNRIL